ncbi:MAG: glycosyltransferase family 4 protein [Hyphomicrobiaceae bacterium]
MPGVKPTILQIIPRLDTGGAELATIEMAGAVVQAGGRALVCTEGGRLADRVSEAGGSLVVFPAGTKNPVSIWRNADRLADLVRRENVSLLHARSRAPAWSALLAARRTGRPFVTTYHGAYSENGRLKRFYNSVMARADTVIANSRYTAGLIRSRYGTPLERIAVIPRGVDLQRFRPDAIAPDRIAALRRSWQVADDARIILHAARLTSWKGQAILIDAVAALAAGDRLGNAVLVMAGDSQGRDDYLGRLRRQVERHGIAGQVRFPGHVEDIAAAYRTAYVTVLASIEPEAFGRAAAEALALGCPVVTTDLGAPPEIVLAEPAVPAAAITGWVCPPTAAALADRLQAALDLSGGERAAMAARAVADVSARFTSDAMKKTTLEVYDRLLGSELALATASTGNAG